jgi:hypothetical protein
LAIVAKWNLSESYYKGLWQQSIKSRTTFRRWVIPISLSLFAVGIALFALQATCGEPLGFGGLAISALAIYQAIWHFWDKRKWFKRVTGGAGFGGEVEMIFAEDGISHRGPTSEGSIQWSGIEGVQRTETGLYLTLQKGISMFVPLQAFLGQDDLTKVMEYFNGAHA